MRLIERQRASQKALRKLPWAEKLRLAAKLRDSIVALRGSPPSRRPTQDASEIHSNSEEVL